MYCLNLDGYHVIQHINIKNLIKIKNKTGRKQGILMEITDSHLVDDVILSLQCE